MIYNEDNIFQIFCPGRLIKSHTGVPGFIITTDITDFKERYEFIYLFFANKGINLRKNAEPFYFTWIFKGIEENSLFPIYDRVLTLKEYKRFSKYVDGTLCMTTIDYAYLLNIINESEKIIFKN